MPHGLDVLAGSVKMLANAIFLGETLPLRLGADLGSVLHDALQCNQALMTQPPEHLCEQLIESPLVVYAEIRQSVMIDWVHAGEPLKSGVDLTQPSNLPS